PARGSVHGQRVGRPAWRRSLKTHARINDSPEPLRVSQPEVRPSMNLQITATSALVFFVACVGKATVVFALAALVVAGMHRASAGSRHHVWTASILAAL